MPGLPRMVNAVDTEWMMPWLPRMNAVGSEWMMPWLQMMVNAVGT